MECELEKKIQEQLRSTALRDLHIEFEGKAAVLMSLFRRRRQLYFLLTKRTDLVSTHKGQVSFPGGMQDREDASLEETALRETQEELGLAPGKVQVWGRFHQYLAVTRSLVTPYVGMIQGKFRLRPNPQEVAYVLEVPLTFFLQTQPERRPYTRFGRQANLYYYHFNGDVIWGLTAAMIKDLVDLLRD